MHSSSLLLGKKSLITGGTSGIGREIAKVFVSQGSDVIIFGTKEENAQATLALLEKERISEDQKISSMLVDVSSYEKVAEAFSEIHEKLGPLDILVNNAGITKDALLLRMKEEDFDEVLRVNLKSVYVMCKHFLPTMIKAKSGVVINISSVIGVVGNAGQANYAASKAGMIGFTKSLAKELAKRGIRVNAIAPGYISTKMTDKIPEKLKDAILDTVPTKRLGTPLDVANAALFLASDLSSYITGQTIHVDGGMVM